MVCMIIVITTYWCKIWRFICSYILWRFLFFTTVYMLVLDLFLHCFIYVFCIIILFFVYKFIVIMDYGLLNTEKY